VCQSRVLRDQLFPVSFQRHTYHPRSAHRHTVGDICFNLKQRERESIHVTWSHYLVRQCIWPSQVHITCGMWQGTYAAKHILFYRPCIEPCGYTTNFTSLGFWIRPSRHYDTTDIPSVCLTREHNPEISPCYVVTCHVRKSWGCGWRRWRPDMEGSCEYIEKVFTDSRQEVVIQLGGWARG
jgi:hypothetical protein